MNTVPNGKHLEPFKGIPIEERCILTPLFYIFSVIGSIILIVGLAIRPLFIIGIVLIIFERKESKKF